MALRPEVMPTEVVSACTCLWRERFSTALRVTRRLRSQHFGLNAVSPIILVRAASPLTQLATTRQGRRPRAAAPYLEPSLCALLYVRRIHARLSCLANP